MVIKPIPNKPKIPLAFTNTSPIKNNDPKPVKTKPIHTNSKISNYTPPLYVLYEKIEIKFHFKNPSSQADNEKQFS